MICKQDCRKAILDKVFQEVAEGRYTFTRMDTDTIRINGKQDTRLTKVQSPAQARAIAQQVAERIRKSFNNHVTVNIEQYSPYDPITLRFTPSQGYIDHVFNTLPNNDKDYSLSPTLENNDTGRLQREYILNNSGPNTNEYFSMSPIVSKGVYLKYIELKTEALNSYFNRLGKITVAKQRQGITQQELADLISKEKDIRDLIYGNKVLGKKGVEQEIQDLQKMSDILAVSPYVEKDLDRLSRLVESTNVDDLVEADKLIKFYTDAGKFTYKEPDANPFFTREDILEHDANGKMLSNVIIDDATRKVFEDWAKRAQGYEGRLAQRYDEQFVERVNNNPLIKKTYGGKVFTKEELLNSYTGLKDIGVVSMWIMDVTSGIMSHNGILPQVMFAELVSQIEEKSGWHRDVVERIDAQIDKLEKALAKLDNGAHTYKGIGIIGLKGVSYNLFKDITKEGNETGALVGRYSNEYTSEEDRVLAIFKEGMKKSWGVKNINTASNLRSQLFREYTNWRRAKSVILDISRLPEIANDSDFDEFRASADQDYKNELIKLLGQNGYDEAIEEQKGELRRYQAERQNILESLLQKDKVADEADLTDISKQELEGWENRHNPLYGHEHYYSDKGRIVGNILFQNYMDYNTFVPRAVKANIKTDGNTLSFEDTNEDTGHYNENFKKIEADPDLWNFYKIAKEVAQTIREVTPYEIQKNLPARSLPALRKTSAEMLLDQNIDGLKALSPAFSKMMEDLRTSVGVTRQSDISTATISDSSKANYKVDDSFLRNHSAAINESNLIEETKFKQAWNSNLIGANNRLDNITQFTERKLSDLNEECMLLIAEYTHTPITMADIRAGRIDAIKAKIGDRVQIGKLIADYSLHKTVQSQSFDLPKILKYFSNLAMLYAARQEALPMMELMKKYYDSINKTDTQNTSEDIYNKKQHTFQTRGNRTRAMTQMESQFERTFLGKEGQKHMIEWGKKERDLSKEQLDKINNNIDEINKKIAALDPATKDYQKQLKELQEEKYREYSKKLIPFLGRKTYTTEQRLKLGQLQELKEKEGEPDEWNIGTIKSLQSAQDKLGKTRTATATLDGFLRWVNALRLGWNVSSMITNFMEGTVSDLMLASTDQYFEPDEIYYAYNALKYSWWKNATSWAHYTNSNGKRVGFKEPPVARKTRALMDRYNVVVDSNTDLQKSSHKSYSNRLEWAGKYAGNHRVEFLNQGALLIATLRSTYITAKDGTTKSKVWDAMDDDGNLKDEFRTEENIKNWEGLSGDQYTVWKNNLDAIIRRGHGNYSQLLGMMLKTGPQKVLITFKTWLPEAIAWRLGNARPDILTGQKEIKGIYRSHTAGSAAIHGAAVGAIAFGLPGAAIGAGVGALASLANRDVHTQIGLLQQSIEVTKELAKRMLGMHVNMVGSLFRKEAIIKTNTKAFSSWIGKGKNGAFTETDAHNLRTNISDIALQLTWLLLILAVKGFLWDDDDKPNSDRRIAHNILVNKLTQMGSQAASYTNIPDIYNNTVGSIGLVQYLHELGKEMTALNKYSQGEDLIATGVNAGDSRLYNETKKILLPGMFKDITSLGFESQGKSEFQPSPYQHFFESEEKLDKKENKGQRAHLKNQLEKDPDIMSITDDKARAKAIQRILNEKLPTPHQLDKLGLTRDEYNQIHNGDSTSNQ